MIAVYKIVNTITGDYYIGSSVNIKRRWREHRSLSVWKKCPNNQLYIDMQKYGRDKFIMEVIEQLSDTDTKTLRNREQYYIKQLQPVYNKNDANTGIKANNKQQYQKQYRSQHTDERKQYRSQHADEIKQYYKQYYSQRCKYNGELLTLKALEIRFSKQGIEHPTLEAKKYLIEQK